MNASTEEIIGIVTTIIAFITLLNDKVQEFFLRKWKALTSKNILINENSKSIDDTIQLFTNRINALSLEFDNLSQSNIETKRLNFQLQDKNLILEDKVSDLERKCLEMTNIINIRCKNDCFGKV